MQKVESAQEICPKPPPASRGWFDHLLPSNVSTEPSELPDLDLPQAAPCVEGVVRPPITVKCQHGAIGIARSRSAPSRPLRRVGGSTTYYRQMSARSHWNCPVQQNRREWPHKNRRLCMTRCLSPTCEIQSCSPRALLRR